MWGWLTRLGKQLPGAAAQEELAELFRTSSPATAVDGQTEGLVVGFMPRAARMDPVGQTVHLLGDQLTSRINLWLGKRFVRSEQRGTNSVTGLAQAVRLIAPTYALRKTGDHYEGFDMRNWVEPGLLDPDVDVLVIDYQENNPWPMTHIRDELVEIVPNTYLGKMLWLQDYGATLLAYFALKSPVA